MSFGWVLVLLGASVTVASTILSNYAILRKNKELDVNEENLGNDKHKLERMRDSEAAAKSSLNHYEDLSAMVQLQTQIQGKTGEGLIETTKESFVQGMTWRYSAVYDVDAKNLAVLKNKTNEWEELFERSLRGDARGIAQARGKLLRDYMKHNNEVVKRIRKLEAQKHTIERSVDRINRLNFGFLVLGILITLMKDLFV